MKLTQEEKKRVVNLVLQSRGLPIPEPKDAPKKLVWKVGENGYFSRMDGKLYVPTEKQGNFIESNAQYSAFLGARGSGKTAAGAQKALNKIKQGESGSVLNPDFENFKYSTWPELKNWIPWDMVVEPQQFRQGFPQ